MVTVWVGEWVLIFEHIDVYRSDIVFELCLYLYYWLSYALWKINLSLYCYVYMTVCEYVKFNIFLFIPFILLEFLFFIFIYVVARVSNGGYCSIYILKFGFLYSWGLEFYVIFLLWKRWGYIWCWNLYMCSSDYIMFWVSSLYIEMMV